MIHHCGVFLSYLFKDKGNLGKSCIFGKDNIEKHVAKIDLVFKSRVVFTNNIRKGRILKRDRKWGVLFVTPFLIGSIIFFIFPVIFSAYISFTKWDLINVPQWIGLKNWINAFKNPVLWSSFRNVFYFAAIFVPLQTIIALLIAYLLNQKVKGKGFFRVIYFLPVVTPWVAGATVWKYIFQYNGGLLNYFLSFFGVEPTKWLESEFWWVAIGSVAIMNVWKGMGQSMVMFLSAMQNTPTEIIEAAEIDGATKRQTFMKVIIPNISPMILLVLISSTIAAFNAFDVFLTSFDIFSIPDRNLVTNILIYRDAFMNWKMGSASSYAWILFIVILVITLIQKFGEKRWVHYEN